MARAVMISAKSGAGRISSNRIGKISTLFNSSHLTTSDKNAHFLLFDSIRVICRLEQPIFSARRGTPAPAPKWGSRQFSTGNKQETNMDSPKCRAKSSTGSTTDVKLTD